jgi:hypothetical protein
MRVEGIARGEILAPDSWEFGLAILDWRFWIGDSYLLSPDSSLHPMA